MKKMIAILPLAVMLANCSTTRNTDTGVASTDDMSVSTSSTVSTDITNANSGNDVNMSGSATVSPNNTWNNEGSSTTTYNSTGSTNWGWDYGGSTGVYTSSYDPNLHSDLDGEWSLAMSPDLSSSWLPDNTTTNTYTWNNGSGTTYTSGSATTGYNTDLNSSTVNSLNTSGATTKTKTKTTGDKTKTKTKTSNGTTISTDVNSGNMSTSSGTDMSTSSSTTTYNSGSATTGGWSNQTLLSSNGNSYMVPKLNLFIGNGSFSGFTGCNAISGRVNTVGNAISFENTMPSTAIDCAGGFSQQAFLDRLQRVDCYELSNGQLLLKQGNTVLLTLNRNSNSSMTTSSNQ